MSTVLFLSAASKAPVYSKETQTREKIRNSQHVGFGAAQYFHIRPSIGYSGYGPYR